MSWIVDAVRGGRRDVSGHVTHDTCGDGHAGKQSAILRLSAKHEALQTIKAGKQDDAGGPSDR